MPIYIALLRAVNVGGTASLPMAELKAICEDLGFRDVKTYIQSGNVLFRSDEKETAVEEKLDAALGQKMGKRPAVMVRTRKELEAIAAKAPFPDAKPNFLLVYFLPEKAADDALDKIVAPDGEEAKLAGREIYVHYPNGSGRSKLKLPALKAGTSRNLNTVRKLAEMAADMEDKD
ncbi:hypothetical protein RLEG12_15635 [Rhizobium leguminosarum bv. trifolii CB782]|uniref:DUF1697 domain-containing protein n=1 Tax=Rhizobium hidalgonense TaxID=1538159 RepID=A0A2A6K455_9HYPH|nr:DUF1697 domain-containing protein [Rhizobium hidalgonense]AHG44567.1 hypothetical protein RLEG12_15635 [Rhizobium leguminosarum bv. trifolii CB782]MDR9775306.1 DUF1697 domain-containing protein [Rhizobium hidalgonense]MDR9813299.1 DUF1697 domain-containing protein [Rhizobium hidalgonense]MDR9821261.1 DUF1697 domain-containing protein [Rhizobium hidalgonense]PDT19666.1 DUF1697 domain-containing protein [Rhizobium hidalgonense]